MQNCGYIRTTLFNYSHNDTKMEQLTQVDLEKIRKNGTYSLSLATVTRLEKTAKRLDRGKSSIVEEAITNYLDRLIVAQ